MRIAYLGDPNNPHTRRWVEFFTQRGHTCAIFCDQAADLPLEGVEIVCPQMSLAHKALAFKVVRHPYSNNLFKAGPYARAVRYWGPDIVHGFEALAFGYAAAACRCGPMVLTPWGNEIFEWAKTSKLAGYLVTKALEGATVITTNASRIFSNANTTSIRKRPIASRGESINRSSTTTGMRAFRRSSSWPGRQRKRG